MANNQIVISRIQNRRGIRENLPQPLLPGEFALTVDTGELWIGTDPNQPPFGIRTYSSASGDITAAEGIADTQVVSAKFIAPFSEADFDSLVIYLTGTPTPAVVLTNQDILWDERETVFIMADTSIDVANTINFILDAVEASTVGDFNSGASGALGALNAPSVSVDLTGAPTLTFATGPDTITRSTGNFITDGFFAGQKIGIRDTASNDGTYTIAAGGVAATVLTLDETATAEGPIAATATMLLGRSDPILTSAFDPTDGDFLFAISGSNAEQGSMASTIINRVHGTQLVTTLANLQVTTTGIGVGTPTFRDMTVTDTDAGYTWADTGTASADSVTDELTFVSGDGIDIQIDPALDAIRVTNTIDSVSATPYTLTTQTPTFANVTDLTFNLETSDISDVIILDYSLNIDGASDTANNYTAIGTMMIVGNILVDSGLATLTDNQVEVRQAALTGAVNFQALYVAGAPDVIQIQYTSTFTPNVTLKVLKRRWASF